MSFNNLQCLHANDLAHPSGGLVNFSYSAPIMVVTTEDRRSRLEAVGGKEARIWNHGRQVSIGG